MWRNTYILFDPLLDQTKAEISYTIKKKTDKDRDNEEKRATSA